MLRQDMVREATRLTRAGRLVEATALLQRMLRGKSAPDSTSRIGRPALIGQEPLIIDAKANAIEENNSPDLIDRTKQRRGFRLRAVIEREPLSTSNIVPDGTRFIEVTYSNPAGSRAYKLFIPSRYQ